MQIPKIFSIILQSLGRSLHIPTKNGRAIRAVFFDLVMTGLAEQAGGRAQQLSKILSKFQAIFTSIGIVESVWSFPYIIIFYVISEQLTTLKLLKVGRAKS